MMTPSYPVVSGEEVIKALKDAEFVQVSQRGSHVKLRHEDGRTVIVPMHKELAIGTFKSIFPLC